ncbi:MAG TPA: FAD-dependent oxidoreductase, partial [Jiangellaceae bacterium]|nr:FAD-dependent oxidoreductase [Jiangellaceae bacterium]
MAENGFVIAGGGLAGAKAAEALREQGFDGSLTILGDETHLPYERPPLSKEYLAGTASRDSLDVHNSDWYREHDVDLRLGTAAEAIDATAHEVVLSGGTRIGYDKLLLATGSRARHLSIPGITAREVFTLRTVEDSDRIDEALTNSSHVAIIGGGWIGMEVAANARGRGAEVTVIEAAQYPLGSALGPELAQVFVDLHQQQGVTLHPSATVSEITADEAGTATGVRLADGTWVPANVVVVAVGAQPNLELAESAGLDINGGVLVDESLQSGDPDICAAGDIASHAHPVLGQRVRVEHWANALNQPAAAAATMLGRPAPYTELPY